MILIVADGDRRNIQDDDLTQIVRAIEDNEESNRKEKCGVGLYLSNWMYI